MVLSNSTFFFKYCNDNFAFFSDASCKVIAFYLLCFISEEFLLFFAFAFNIKDCERATTIAISMYMGSNTEKNMNQST